MWKTNFFYLIIITAILSRKTYFCFVLTPPCLFWLTILPQPSQKPQPDACFDLQFSLAFQKTTTLKLQTLATKLLLVSSFQNCELKQEASTLTTELQQTHEFNGHEKTKKQTGNSNTLFLQTPAAWKKVFYRSRNVGWNCSEFVASGDTFVLTLNRASPTPQIPQSWKKVFFRSRNVGWNCSEIVTSGRIFVLTLNRASAVKVEGNE